jgi:ribose transport system substrate-binding protein
MKRGLRFVIVPKLAHPWFDEVHQGAQEQASLLSRELGREITIDFLPPARADVAEQNAVLEQVVQRRPDGIAVDPVDAIGHLSAIERIRVESIPVVLFDSPSPTSRIPGVGNDFIEQGRIAAERLVERIGHAGKVALMQGVPSAPNHRQRYESQLAVLRRYPAITLVDGGSDHDDIAVARKEASKVLAAHPDLKGYLCCDASGPVGIAAAIKEAGKIGKVTVVSMDGIEPILEAIKEGIIDSSSATIPRMQGSMAVLMLWQATLGMPLPQTIDTGIDLITQENVERFRKLARPA